MKQRAKGAKLQGFSAVFGVSDVEKSLAYFCDRLGFAEIRRSGSPANQAVVERDGVSIHLTLAHYPFGKTNIYVMVDDVDHLYRELDATDCQIDGKPNEVVSGMRELSVRDLDGNRIIFAQELAEAAKRVLRLATDAAAD